MALEKLLDTSSFRRLQLIELLFYDDIWWKIDKLSKKLNCSSRTMIADIQTINNLSGEIFYVKTSKQRGVKLIASDMFHMDDVYQYLMETSLNFQIIKKIIELDKTNSQDLSELLYTSQSSINRGLKQIKAFLRDYELDIQQSPIKIIGTEKQIRYFFSIFICEYYSSNTDGFQHPSLRYAVQFLSDLKKKNESPPLSFLTHYRILIWIVMCSDRISKGYIIEDTYELPEWIYLKITDSFSELIANWPYELPDKELKFLMYIYWNNCRNFKTSELENDPTLKEVNQTLLSFVNQVKKATGYRIEDEAFLLTNLMGYCFYRKFFKGPSNILLSSNRWRKGTSINLFNEFIKTVKAVIKLEQPSSWLNEIKEDELIFILMIYWKGLVSQVVSAKEKIHILIVSYAGIQHELFLVELIETRFSNKVKCHASSLEKVDNKKIQLILADHQVRQTKQLVGSSKIVIGIDIIPSNRDWIRIEKGIKNIQRTQNLMKRFKEKERKANGTFFLSD